MKRLEVRCCCQPTKLLGFLEVTEAEIAQRAVTVCKLSSVFDVPLFMQRPDIADAVDLPKTYRLPIVEFRPGPHQPSYLAVKAEGLTEADLDGVRAFTPWRAVPHQHQHKGK